MGEGGAEQSLSFLALASQVKTFSLSEIRTFLLLRTLCLQAKSVGKGIKKEESFLTGTPLWWVLAQKETEGDDSG